MVRYSVAMCNYEMAETLERSLRSVLDQVDDEYEVLVVDDGSTDGSRAILDELSDAYDTFRWVAGRNDNLAEARNQSFAEARGDYVLESLDVDDVYDEVIQDFVTIYHAFEDHQSDAFYLKGDSINMAPRDLLLEVPYRSLGYGEDQDLWRRLLARDAIIWLDHGPVKESIGYDRTTREKLRAMGFEMTKVTFRSGVTFPSFLIHKLRNLDDKLTVAQVLLAPLAYVAAVRAGLYEAPEGYERMGALPNARDRLTRPLREYEGEYGFSVRGELSLQGQEVFYEQV